MLVEFYSVSTLVNHNEENLAVIENDLTDMRHHIFKDIETISLKPLSTNYGWKIMLMSWKFYGVHNSGVKIVGSPTTTLNLLCRALNTAHIYMRTPCSLSFHILENPPFSCPHFHLFRRITFSVVLVRNKQTNKQTNKQDEHIITAKLWQR